MSLARFSSALRMAITRGRVVLTTLNPKRALVQVTGLAGEVKDKIELLLPYGMSAYPPKGGDVLLMQVGGSRSHLIALLADDSALRIPDLQEGEFGFRDKNGQQVVFRHDKLEVTTPLDLVGNVTGDVTLTVGGDLTADVTGDVTVGSSGTITLNASTKIVMNTPELDVNGKITATGDIKGGNIVLQTHKHSGVQAGGANSGGPIP